MSQRRLLLLSSSREGSTGFLQHAESMLSQFLGSDIKRVLFIPYASVHNSYDYYAARVADVFTTLGYELTSIHQCTYSKKAIVDAEALVVGGGNSFHLLNQLYVNDLLDVIRERVFAGMPYIGWSAGAIIAGDSIATTNDMPIVQPPSFKALQLEPVHINPHFTIGKIPGHHGESRIERLQGFLQLNPNAQVVALAEGSAIKREGDQLSLLGRKTAFIYSADKPVRSVNKNDLLNNLLGQ